MRQAVKLGYRLAHPKQICQDIVETVQSEKTAELFSAELF